MKNVRYRTLSPFLPRSIAEARDNPHEGIGWLYMPQEPVQGGRHPAVVVVEGLGGIKRRREHAYGEFLARHGCVALVADSFATRSAAWLPDDMRALLVTEAMMLADAYAALLYLSRHEAVDADRIYVMGFSYGGMISALAAYEQFAKQLAPEGERFAGHVSYYGCSIPRMVNHEATGAPVLAMLGELDRNVSVERWRQIADDLRQGGADVDLDVIDGAYHQWDSDDVEMRHVRFNLRRSAIRVEPDNEIYDEHTQSRLRGPVSRALAIARHADPSGYDILRNEDVMRYSDKRLLDFIAGTVGKVRKDSRHIEASRP